MVKAFIFDMDGTLVDNCAWHVKAWREFARRHGHDVSERNVLEWMGSPSMFYLERIFGRRISPEECEELSREKEALYREMYAPSLRLPDGLGDILRKAEEHGVSFAIATGGPRYNVDFVLDGLGLRSLFGVVVDSSMYSRGKPAPDCYLMAAETMGVPPRECIVFEDALAGIRAAKAAGMKVAAITATMPREALAAEKPDWLFDSFAQFDVDRCLP